MFESLADQILALVRESAADCAPDALTGTLSAAVPLRTHEVSERWRRPASLDGTVRRLRPHRAAQRTTRLLL